MHIKIPQTKLFKVVSNCGNVIEATSAHEMLSHVLIIAEAGGQLTVIGTDMEISIVEKTTAEVIIPGRITLDGAILNNILNKCSPTAMIELNLEPQNSRVVLKADLSIFNLPTLSAQQFPAIENHTFKTRFTIPFNQFKHLLDMTSFAISHEETRYHLNGVFLHSKNPQELRIVATDGHRLTKAQCHLNDLPDSIPSVIISKKTVDIISSIAKRNDYGDAQQLTLDLSDTLIQFSVDNLVIIARVIDGTFPDYERVIPKKDKSIYVDLDAINIIVTRATIFGNEKVKGIKISFDENKMRFSYKDKMIGSANDEIAIIYKDEPFEIGFNSKYIIDAARNLKLKSDAEIWIQDENTPILIKNSQSDDAICVIMPMRL